MTHYRKVVGFLVGPWQRCVVCFVCLFLFPPMELNLGPICLGIYSGDNWTSIHAGFITNREGGMAARETAIRASFKSDHLTEIIGRDNPADTFECPDTSTLFFGRIIQTPTGTYCVTAKEVYTKALYTKAVKRGLQEASASTAVVDETTPAAAKPKARTRTAVVDETTPAAAKPKARTRRARAAKATTKPAAATTGSSAAA